MALCTARMRKPVIVIECLFCIYFSMRYDTASSTFTLQIKDVQRYDEATYQCQIIVAINNKVTRHVKLRVSQPPVISDNSTRY